MNARKRLLSVVGLALAAGLYLLVRAAARPQSLDASGPYLGQAPPGTRAERFAPGILPRDLHSTPAFSPDGQWVYWKAMDGPGSNRLAYSHQRDGRWTAPRAVSLGLFTFGADDPELSSDGGTLYFTSWRPRWRRPLAHRERIWQVSHPTRPWSRPRPLSDAVNAMDLHWQFSMAENGALYFAANGDLYRAPLVDGKHGTPQRLGPAVNSAGREGTPFVAPDESYLLFSSNGQAESLGTEDLYVSFVQVDGAGSPTGAWSNGSWSAAVNLGPAVNSAATELCPRVSPDGRTLFFLSSRSGTYDAYWIDAQIIRQLAPADQS